MALCATIIGVYDLLKLHLLLKSNFRFAVELDFIVFCFPPDTDRIVVGTEDGLFLLELMKECKFCPVVKYTKRVHWHSY